MLSTTATHEPSARSLRDIALDLDDALDHVERVASIPLGGYVELPALASKIDRIASAICEIELSVPDEFCEQLDIDLSSIRSDMRRLAATLMAAANGSRR